MKENIRNIDELGLEVDTKLDLFDAVMQQVKAGEPPSLAHLQLASRVIDRLLELQNVIMESAVESMNNLAARSNRYKQQRDEHFCVLVEQTGIHQAGHC